MREDNQNKIILYPSNWLYNAGVVGFLRILKELNGKYRSGEFVEIDLTNLDSDKIFEQWDKMTYEKLRYSYKGKTGGTQKYYYSNQTEKSIKNKIEALFKFKEKQTKAKRKMILSCSFCGISKSTTKSEMEVLNQTFSNVLLGSEKSFPNTYWMLKSREFVCPKCAFIIMCHHIPFVTLKDIYEAEIFVNTPLFSLTEDLNTFVEEVLKKSKEFEVRKLLGTSLLQWAIKRRTLLGAWTMMNIEVIIKKRILVDKDKNKWETIIDYFDLPDHITKILLDYEIANLIQRIGEEKIFELILNGKFSEIEKANYFVLRALLKIKNNEKLQDNDPVTRYIDNFKDKEHLSRVSNLLPELYAKITKTLKTEVNYG